MFKRPLARRHLRQLDLSSVRRQLQARMLWAPDRATLAEADYKRFLFALVHCDEDEIFPAPTAHLAPTVICSLAVT